MSCVRLSFGDEGAQSEALPSSISGVDQTGIHQKPGRKLADSVSFLRMSCRTNAGNPSNDQTRKQNERQLEITQSLLHALQKAGRYDRWTEVYLETLFKHPKGIGVSFGDIDNDGDQDVYRKMGGAVSGDVYHNLLYENPGHGNHWITLELQGVQSNRAGIGARIRVVVNSLTEEHSYYKTVSTGGSFGASPLRQEMGLGQAQSLARVEIFWPRTGRTQALTGLAMDHFYKVTEGESQAVLWNLKSFHLASHRLPSQAQQHHHQN